VERKNPKCIGNCSTEIQPQCTQAPTEKGLQNSFKQKKTRKDPHPTKLDFQNSNHLHDLGRNAKGQLTISSTLAKLFAQKVYSDFREMKKKCLLLACINILVLRTIGICSCSTRTLDIFLFFQCF
jgi:hypothetical protein